MRAPQAPGPSAPHVPQPARVLAATVSATGLLLAAGCTTLPGDSAPEAVSSYVPAPNLKDVVEPSRGEASDLLLRDFFQASAHPLGNHQAARKFLTDNGNRNWDSGQSTVILDRIDIASEGAVRDGRISYRVRGNVVGTLGPGGVYNPEYTAYEASYEMTRSDGEWRIDNLQDVVVLDRADFVDAYQARDLYFVAPQGTTLVPDRRWVYTRQQSVGSSLISLLSAGPQPLLEKGVETSIPAGATVQTSAPPSGGFQVDFSGLTSLQPQERELLAAQVVWTLAASDVRGPYAISADGAPLNDKIGREWTVGDVAQFNPRAESVMPLRAVINGALVEVNGQAAQKIGGWVGQETVESAGVSPQDSILAVVATADRQRKLMVGPQDGTAVEAVRAGSLSQPTWGVNTSTLYTVADGRKVLRFNRSATTGELSKSEVDASTLSTLGLSSTQPEGAEPTGRISVFRVSRDGVRAVMLINGRVYVSVLERTANGQTVLGRPVEVGAPLGDSAVSAAWRADNTLVVGTRNSEAPVWTLALDGSFATALSPRNISAPVVGVASAGTVTYATDSRALMQLDSAERETRFWREEPTLQGQRAVPVLGH